MFAFFDLDGTLADTDPDIRGAWKAALADLGLDCPDFDVKFVAGPPIDEMTKALFPDRFTPALADAIREAFARHYDRDGFSRTREYPGVLDAVRRLKADGFTLAIVTNKRFVGATAVARHFGWDGVFDGLFAGDMTPPKVRKPELLKRVISAYGAAPSDCVLVGDTASDFEAAAANGVRSVGVTWGYGRPEELAQADATCRTPEELVRLVRAAVCMGA